MGLSGRDVSIGRPPDIATLPVFAGELRIKEKTPEMETAYYGASVIGVEKPPGFDRALAVTARLFSRDPTFLRSLLSDLRAWLSGRESRSKIQVARERKHLWYARESRGPTFVGGAKTGEFETVKICFSDREGPMAYLGEVMRVADTINEKWEGENVFPSDVLLAEMMIQGQRDLIVAEEKIKEIFDDEVPERIDPLGDECDQVAEIYKIAEDDPSILLALRNFDDGTFGLNSLENGIRVFYDGRPVFVNYSELKSFGAVDSRETLVGLARNIAVKRARLQEENLVIAVEESHKMASVAERIFQKGNGRRRHGRAGLTFVLTSDHKETYYAGDSGNGLAPAFELAIDPMTGLPDFMSAFVPHLIMDESHAGRYMVSLYRGIRERLIGFVREEYGSKDVIVLPDMDVSYPVERFSLPRLKEKEVDVTVEQYVFSREESRMVERIAFYYGVSPKIFYEMSLPLALKRVAQKHGVKDFHATAMNCVKCEGSRRLSEIPLLPIKEMSVEAILEFVGERKQMIKEILSGGLSLFDRLTLSAGEKTEEFLRGVLRVSRRDHVTAVFGPSGLFSWDRLPSPGQTTNGDDDVRFEGFSPALVDASCTVCSVGATEYDDGRVGLGFRGGRKAIEEYFGVKKEEEQRKILEEVEQELINSVHALVAVCAQGMDKDWYVKKNGKVTNIGGKLPKISFDSFGRLAGQGWGALVNWGKRAERFSFELDVPHGAYEAFALYRKVYFEQNRGVWSDLVGKRKDLILEAAVVAADFGMEEADTEWGRHFFESLHKRLSYLFGTEEEVGLGKMRAKIFAQLVLNFGLDNPDHGHIRLSGNTLKKGFSDEKIQDLMLDVFFACSKIDENGKWTGEVS